MNIKITAQKFYAHSVKGKPIREWRGLHDYLLNVANLTKKFVEAFSAGDWAYVAGLLIEINLLRQGFKYVS